MPLKLALALVAALLTSACVPVAIGAGGAIIADQVAEDQGGDLF